MKILLSPNYKKAGAVSCSLAIAGRLLELGVKPLADHSAAGYLGDACAYGEYGRLLEECDMVMSVGGDGTMMRAAKDAMLADKPLVGVNAGRLGFLTQLESCELDKLSLLAEGKYGISERMLLYGEIAGGEDGGEAFTALNDIVASHGNASGVADIEVRASERLITRQRADGIIFATPTGSTAYSLSAGGPVVDPELELVIITAICPHAAFRYSLALPVKEPYKVREVSPGGEGSLIVTADGKKAAVMGPDERLIIRKHKRNVKFIELGPRDFYGRLGEKLSWTK